MDKYDYIDGFESEGFVFEGAYSFGEEKSDYYFILGKNGGSIIINSVLLKSLVAKKPDDNLKFKLIQHGLARMEEKAAFGDDYEDLLCGNRIPTPSFFLIDITKKCNLNCIYCFRDLNDKRTIRKETLKDICNFILEETGRQNQKYISIQLWGGEPLLAFECIEFTYQFFKETEINVSIEIETNGTLVTDEIAQKLHSMNIRVGVSIDGLAEHQNRQRVTTQGFGSMDLLKRGILSLKKYYGDSLGGITVITKYNFRDIEKIIKYYVYELGIHNIKFNIVKDNPNASEASVGLTLEEVKQFAEELCHLIPLYNALGVPFCEANIQTRIENLTKRSACSCCVSNGCKGGVELISIDMKGDIYPCDLTDFEEFKIGSIYQAGKENALAEQVMESQKKNPYFVKKSLEKCKDCPWAYYCKGGCTSRIYYSKYESGLDEAECEFNKVVYPKIISQILKNHNN